LKKLEKAKKKGQKKKSKKKETQKKKGQKKRSKKKKALKKVVAEKEVAVVFSPQEIIEETIADEPLVEVVEAPVEVETPAAPVVETSADHSSNYNTKDALVVLRTLTSVEAIETFTAGEKRVTITRALPGMKRRLGTA